jgi:hypothetical protein
MLMMMLGGCAASIASTFEPEVLKIDLAAAAAGIL